MTCPFCGSNNMAATEFFKDTDKGFTEMYECRSCYYYGFRPDKLTVRRLKLEKIKEKI